MDPVRWEHRPTLRTPVLVAAFAGWNDAGDAATSAVRHLVDAFDAVRFGEIDAEEFFDFQQTRPTVRLVNGSTREIVWPSTTMHHASTPGGDIVLLLGSEPQLRWRTFCESVIGVASALGVRMVMTLGALLADVSHRGDVRIIGTSSDQSLIRRFDLQRSRYEGPTGIVGVLHDACAQAGIPSVSLWAACPAYAPGTPSPKAALALVQATGGLIGSPVPAGDLDELAGAYEEEVDAAVAADDELAGYVRRLDLLDDDEDDEDDDEVDDDDPDDDPAGEVGGGVPQQGDDPSRLVEEVERFLRDHGRE